MSKEIVEFFCNGVVNSIKDLEKDFEIQEFEGKDYFGVTFYRKYDRVWLDATLRKEIRELMTKFEINFGFEIKEKGYK